MWYYVILIISREKFQQAFTSPSKALSTQCLKIFNISLKSKDISIRKVKDRRVKSKSRVSDINNYTLILPARHVHNDYFPFLEVPPVRAGIISMDFFIHCSPSFSPFFLFFYFFLFFIMIVVGVFNSTRRPTCRASILAPSQASSRPVFTEYPVLKSKERSGTSVTMIRWVYIRELKRIPIIC